MRLIDADALEKEMQEMIKKRESAGIVGVVGAVFEGCVDGIFEVVKRQPTIEARPVVYCKDCKYNVANSKHEPLDITDYTDITCEYFMTDGMSPNDYCSQGVKIPVISMKDVPKIMKEMVSI